MNGYIVTDNNGIPLEGQPLNGYTLQRAVNRHSREVREAVDLFGVQAKEADRWFMVYKMGTWEKVL